MPRPRDARLPVEPLMVNQGAKNCPLFQLNLQPDFDCEKVDQEPKDLLFLYVADS